jgi:hypothetical protein
MTYLFKRLAFVIYFFLNQIFVLFNIVVNLFCHFLSFNKRQKVTSLHPHTTVHQIPNIKTKCQ